MKSHIYDIFKRKRKKKLLIEFEDLSRFLLQVILNVFWKRIDAKTHLLKFATFFRWKCFRNIFTARPFLYRHFLISTAVKVEIEKKKSFKMVKTSAISYRNLHVYCDLSSSSIYCLNSFMRIPFVSMCAVFYYSSTHLLTILFFICRFIVF